MTEETTGSAAPAPFRVCGCCKQEWATASDFIRDPELLLLGLQLIPKSPKGNLLVFGHACGTSISVFTGLLRPLVLPAADAADPPDSIGYEECSRYCMSVEEIVSCLKPCPRAGDRSLLQLILEIQGKNE
ncbi:MAG TPA: hypothetical protein VLC48_01925 [Gemmatimonadota bacterium]|nr:hypothetical protein [Gemmatimonadota bacterium]